MHARIRTLGGKSSRKQSAAGTNGDLQQTARGVYWRLRLATMTTDASKNRFRSPRERGPKFPPRLFTPHIVRFDERKCRRVNLWPTILPCPRPRREISPRGDVYIKSTIIMLLVRLFGGVRRRVAFLTGDPIERENHRFSSKRIGPS